MKKILFIRFSNSPYGGAQRYLKRLDNELKSLGVETNIIFSKLPKILPSWLKVLLFDRYIKQITKKQKSSLIFSLDRVSRVDIYRAGDGVHKEYLKTKGFSLNPLHLVYLYLEKQTFNSAKLIIANSNMVKEQIVNNYKIDEKKITVIYNGIPIPNSIDEISAKKRLVDEFGIDKNRAIILFVGSGFERKGVMEFLKIISLIKTPYTAFIVGKDKNITKYKKEAKKLGIEESVIFTGARSDVEIFYDASDIFLFPTKYEPFSNVILEAMSRRCIVFTTRQNGASEVIENKFIMDSANDISIYKRIETLLNNRAKLTEYKEKAQYIAKDFSIEHNAKKTLEAIEPFLAT